MAVSSHRRIVAQTTLRIILASHLYGQKSIWNYYFSNVAAQINPGMLRL